MGGVQSLAGADGQGDRAGAEGLGLRVDAAETTAMTVKRRRGGGSMAFEGDRPVAVLLSPATDREKKW